MNTSVLEPLNRLHLPHGAKVLAAHIHGKRLFLGLSNGDLSIFNINHDPERAPVRTETKSVKSFRSFSEVRRLFLDNDTSQVLVREKTFVNVSGNMAPITTLTTIDLYVDQSREVLLIGTPDLLQVYEWVGPHLNLVRVFDEIRSYGVYEYIDLSESGKIGSTGRKKVLEPVSVDPPEKLLLIAARKRLYVYKVVHKLRNIFEFVALKEILMKERIKGFCALAGHAKALVATVQNIHTLDLAGGDFHVQVVANDSPTAYSFAPASSFSYFGLSNAGPYVALVPTNSSEFLIVRDTETGILRVQNDTVTWYESRICLTAVPLTTAFLLPCYVVFVYAKTFEVVDIDSGLPVQNFKHLLGTASNVFSLDQVMALISAGPDVFQFKVASIQKQLDNFLGLRGTLDSKKNKRDPRQDLRLLGLEQAIVLIKKLDENHDFFTDRTNNDTGTSGTKQKQLFLRDLYKEKAMIYFTTYLKYHEALAELASEWMVSFNEVLHLFPDFLNGSIQIKQGKNAHPTSSQNNAVKRVTVAELQAASDPHGKNVASSDSDLKGDGNENTPLVPQHIRHFYKAVQNLIVFLTEQRRVHLSFLNSSDEDPFIPWKNLQLYVSDLYPGLDKKIITTKLTEYAAAIDTSLFLCYYFTKPMMLGPLLRLPHNRCNARVVNDCLLNSSSLDSRDQITFISQLLDFYYGRSLHDEALRLLNNLASENVAAKNSNPNIYLTGPALSIRYMQRLSNEHLDLIFKYAHWVLTEEPVAAIENAALLFMNDSFECESYDRFRVLDFILSVIKNDDMAIAYLEWLLNESGILDVPGRKREIPKLSTRLCLLYLKKMAALNGSNERFYASSPYRKLEKLLGSGIEYEPWTVLKNIPASEDKYLRLTVFIYHRLGEHQKSVDILYNQLGDLDEAMEYCAKVHDEPSGTVAGQKLLFKLLEDLLMHYDENKDAIARLLSLQGGKMPTLQLLTALPDSFPLQKLQVYLKQTSDALEEEKFVTRMKSQLYKIGASKVHYELVMAQAQHYSISGPGQKCAVCKKSLGSSVTCVDTANKIVHYGCIASKETG